MPVTNGRHYDEIGLLQPAYVDPHTGYRWYATAQLPALNRILLLRELGFGLAEIAADLDPAVAAAVDVDGAHARREHELQAELAGTAARLPAELVATLAAVDDGPAAFYSLEEYVRSHSARAVRPPMTLLGDDGTASVAVPVIARLPDSAGVSGIELTAVPAMACTVHSGRYEDLGGHLQRMLGWLEQTGREPAGSAREVYLRFEAEPELRLPPVYLTDDADELVTELQVPLSR